MLKRILGIFLCFSVNAQITLTTENDLFFNTDRNFTHGTQLGYKTNNKEYFIFQNIYTPEDTQSLEEIKDDRRYSGVLALGVELKRDREYGGIVDKYMAGGLGPSAEAEWSQNTVHNLRNIETAKGWRNQLDDRPVFLLSREFIIINDHPNFQVGQVFKLDGGNLFTGAKYSIPVRFGYNLQDYSSDRIKIEAANDWSFGLEWITAAQYVGYDATLDGVNKEEFYGEYSIGGFLNFKKFGVGIYRVTRTEQWEDGKGSNFGTISLKF